jgi:hypothetical protein
MRLRATFLSYTATETIDNESKERSILSTGNCQEYIRKYKTGPKNLRRVRKRKFVPRRNSKLKMMLRNEIYL